MAKYDYMAALKADIREYIEENRDYIDTGDREALYDALWLVDSVTGNGSGSYTLSRDTARQYVLENLDLYIEAADEFCIALEEIGRQVKGGYWESMDVTVRCYLLGVAIDEVLEEMEEQQEEQEEPEELEAVDAAEKRTA